MVMADYNDGMGILGIIAVFDRKEAADFGLLPSGPICLACERALVSNNSLLSCERFVRLRGS